jgi:hypothetical protein
MTLITALVAGLFIMLALALLSLAVSEVGRRGDRR